MPEGVLKEKGDRVLLNVRVKAGSQKFEIGNVNPWRNHLKIRVGSRPERGKANRELLEELESILERDVRIVAGKRSEEKKLLIENITRKEVVRKLDLEGLANGGGNG